MNFPNMSAGFVSTLNRGPYGEAVSSRLIRLTGPLKPTISSTMSESALFARSDYMQVVGSFFSDIIHEDILFFNTKKTVTTAQEVVGNIIQAINNPLRKFPRTVVSSPSEVERVVKDLIKYPDYVAKVAKACKIDSPLLKPLENAIRQASQRK